MSLTLHVVDAFTARPFAGNPAAIGVLAAPRPDAWMQSVAAEMNLSETAFLLRVTDGFSLRWFTPKVEVDLCGHATLASAHVLWETDALGEGEPAVFHTRSGALTCRRVAGWIEMDFPAVPIETAEPPAELAAALGAASVATVRAGVNWLAEFSDAATVRALSPDFARLASILVQGFIATAPSDDPTFDFVSRYFAPAAGIDEDPVTGSAHCALGPYWQQKTGRTDFTAFQASARGGVVKLSVRGSRVLLRGQAVSVSRVEWLVD